MIVPKCPICGKTISEKRWKKYLENEINETKLKLIGLETQLNLEDG